MAETSTDFDHELAQAQNEAREGRQLLRDNGFVVDTTEWLTIKRYAGKYGLTTQVVTNWITRGVIPENSIMILPELNDLRLVKDQIYR